MPGATQSVSQRERHLAKARDFLTDHPDSFQREMRHCCCTSQDGLLGSSQGMRSHPAPSSFAQPQQPVSGGGDTSLDWDLGRNSHEPCISWCPQQPDFAFSQCYKNWRVTEAFRGRVPPRPAGCSQQLAPRGCAQPTAGYPSDLTSNPSSSERRAEVSAALFIGTACNLQPALLAAT